MEIIVKECCDCPFFLLDGEFGRYCGHPKDERAMGKRPAEYFAACPLKSEPITITLNQPLIK